MSLGELGYHPAYQPAPGETHYIDNTMTREYTTNENIAGAVILGTLLFPGYVAAGVVGYGRIVWSLSRSALGRAVFAGPVAQYGKVKALDTYINRADLIYTTYQFMQHRDRFRESPGNSSQVLPAGSARPGGTKQGYLIGDKKSRVLDNMRHPHQYSSVCRKGYFAKKVRGQWMCVPKASKKSRSR